MSEEMEKKSKPSLDDLLRCSKIVSPFKGYLAPKEHLKTILDAVDSKFSKDLPVAILGVVGQRGSGKSFLTNFLIQYLRAGCEGGWMSNITKKGELGRGFSWGSISNQAFYKPDDISAATSGVYLWPEPFLMKKSGDKQIVVWIMHIHSSGNDDSAENMDEMEKFLALACSRIIEIHGTNDHFRILEHYRSISSQSNSAEPISMDELCKSIVFVNRSEAKVAAAGTDEESKKELLKIIMDSGKDGNVYQAIIDKFNHMNLLHMKKCPKVLHDNNGILNKEAWKTIRKCIKEIVDTTMEESEIVQKIGADGGLTLENMHDFLISAAKKTSTKKLGGLGETMDETLQSDFDVSASSNRSRADSSNSERPRRIKGIRNTTPTVDGVTSSMLSLTIGDQKCDLTGTKTNDVEPPAGICNDQKISDKKSKTVSLYTSKQETKEAFTSYQECQAYQHQARVPVDMKPDDYSSFSHMGLSQNAQTPLQNAESQGGNQHGYCKRGDAMKPGNISDQKFNHATTPNYNASPHRPQPTYTTQFPDGTGDDQMDIDPSIETGTASTSGSNNDHKQPVSVSTYLPSPPTIIKQAIVKTTIKPTPMDIDDNTAQEEATKKLKDEAEKKAVQERMEAQKAESDRLKKEKEEEIRKQEEKARSEMEECFHIAVSQLKYMLLPSLDYWIENHLNISSINQMETVYANLFKGITEEHSRAIHSSLWKEFTSRVDGHCKSDCIKTLRSIANPTLKISNNTKRQFTLHGYLTTSKLEQIVTQEFQKETKDIEDKLIVEKIASANSRLFNIYKEHNTLIVKTEMDLVNIAKNEIMSLYREEMKRYLKNAPFSPQRFQKIHFDLVEKLVDAFKNACKLSNSVDEVLSEDAVSLKEDLDNEFPFYKQSNEIKLRKLQQETSKIIQTKKTQYNEKIEEVLSKNPDGLDVRTLGKHHAAIQTEVMKLLEMEIRSKIRSNEPLDNHQKVLQAHIDSYWPTVVAANKKSLTMTEARLERQRREQKKLEAERELKETEERDRRARASNENFSSTVSAAGERKMVQSSRNSGSTNLPSLPPLIFHLQSSRIVMAMETGTAGHITLLRNASGEEQTPAFVVLTSENTFVYGSAAQALIIESPQTSGPEGLYWSVADFFLIHNLTWSKTICINSNDYTITTEFLLGFLLRQLRQAVEHQLNGRCGIAVLAIPFWLSSPQRIQVKDAAKLAGFSEVYLINEASAAAYNFAVSCKRSTSAAEVIVMSENLDRVDAFVYEYFGCTKKLKMLSHAGNYGNADNKDKSGGPIKAIKKVIFSGFHHVSNGCNYILNMLSQSKTEDAVTPDYTSQEVRKLCKNAVDRAASTKHKKIVPHESLFICENSNKWEKTLDLVVRDFGRKATDINENDAVIQGAVILSRKPKEIGELVRDKPAYEVLRDSWGGGIQVINKNDLLQPHTKIHNSWLLSNKKEAQFYQIVIGTRHDIGDLRVIQEVDHNQTVVPNLEITNEAVVKLKNVNVNSKHGNLKSLTTLYLPESQFQWITPNLPKERLTELTSLMDFVVEPPPPKEDPELIQAKSLLLHKCQKMTEKIDGGQFKIKSSLVKEKVLEKISEACLFAKHANSKLNDVQKQMEDLEKLCDKYDKK